MACHAHVDHAWPLYVYASGADALTSQPVKRTTDSTTVERPVGWGRIKGNNVYIHDHTANRPQVELNNINIWET